MHYITNQEQIQEEFNFYPSILVPDTLARLPACSTRCIWGFLHLAGEPELIPAELVESLRNLALIQSNLKLPAATYVLTDPAIEVLSDS